MKSKVLFVLFFLYTFSISAKEGMWLPFLLEKLNEKEMKAMGMKMSAKDIYDINQGSLKDAVVLFGGGCTGEVISDKGLVLTNHHCGYGTVQGLSSLENNYLTNGFWAKNQQEELPCPGLSVTFIVNIIDVTADVLEGTSKINNLDERAKAIAKNIEEIEKEYQKNTGYVSQIKSFFYENEYYLFLLEKFNDVRLVGFPPNGIGKFGGDTDNWAWPRHTGDFGLFRIYANQSNKPANYSKENIPYIPKKSFKINIKGLKENDFTMVYGFPGRTNEYLTSDGVAETMSILDPARIKLREARLKIMEESMKSSEAIFIQYASKQAGIANYYKKWKGELFGLEVNNAIEKKKSEEKQFQQWVLSDNKRKEKYQHLLADISTIYQQQQNQILLNEYINESIWASELLRRGSILARMLTAVDTVKHQDSLKKYQNELQIFQKSVHLETDYKIAKQLFEYFNQDIFNQSILDKKDNHYISDENLQRIYKTSFVCSTDKLEKLIQVQNKNDFKTLILQDNAYQTFQYFDSVQKANLVILKQNAIRLNTLYATYINGLREFHVHKKFYPDANSTLRVTYGKVEGVAASDGIKYTYYTTLDGAVRKANPQIEEFNMPAKLMQLYQQKDYGNYSIIDERGNKTVPIAFLASNHTTGGNSGSPVINANGELIGTNFDRIWEGTMSDILFDPTLCRNISLDIRYTLFIIEKFGGAKWVIDELKIVK